MGVNLVVFRILAADKLAAARSLRCWFDKMELVMCRIHWVEVLLDYSHLNRFVVGWKLQIVFDRKMVWVVI